jgi:hypothetical protein
VGGLDRAGGRPMSARGGARGIGGRAREWRPRSRVQASGGQDAGGRRRVGMWVMSAPLISPSPESSGLG